MPRATGAVRRTARTRRGGELAQELVARLSIEPTERARVFLARHGEHGRSLLDVRWLRFREMIVQVGETICVAGTGIRERDRDAESSYRAVPTRLRFTSSPKLRPLITDDPSKR